MTLSRNLYQYFCELGAEVLVRRNDALTLEEIAALAPEKIVISPGPARRMRRDFPRGYPPLCRKTPLLGVCLGHQAIARAFGATIVRAAQVMHGKTSLIEHNGEGCFRAE
nr:Para-aminobenzoate synthase glutamine amidotransferase component II [Klebsiella pneumoniae]